MYRSYEDRGPVAPLVAAVYWPPQSPQTMSLAPPDTDYGHKRMGPGIHAQRVMTAGSLVCVPLVYLCALVCICVYMNMCVCDDVSVNDCVCRCCFHWYWKTSLVSCLHLRNLSAMCVSECVYVCRDLLQCPTKREGSTERGHDGEEYVVDCALGEQSHSWFLGFILTWA